MPAVILPRDAIFSACISWVCALFNCFTVSSGCFLFSFMLRFEDSSWLLPWFSLLRCFVTQKTILFRVAWPVIVEKITQRSVLITFWNFSYRSAPRLAAARLLLRLFRLSLKNLQDLYCCNAFIALLYFWYISESSSRASRCKTTWPIAVPLFKAFCASASAL